MNNPLICAQASSSVDRDCLVVDLSHYGLIRFHGDDARSFLHAQLSCDVNALQPGQASFGSYNTPKGRMLASFILWFDGSGFFMQLRTSLQAAVQKRLSMYVLRSKVKLVDASKDLSIIGLIGNRVDALLESRYTLLPQLPLSLTTAEDAMLLRHDATRVQIVVPSVRSEELRSNVSAHCHPQPAGVWDRLDINAGIPWITAATQEQFVPQMVNLDLIGGISFNKGCYPGQEIVARMHYLGRLKERMYLAHVSADAAPQAGDKVFSAAFGDQASGMIVNAAPAVAGGYDVLAVVKIESATQGDVHWRAPDGPPLEFGQLPYPL